MTRYTILDMPIDRLAPDEFASRFVNSATEGSRGYVCVPNVHQCMEAYDKPDFKKVVQNADIVMSDSKVLQQFVRLKYGLPPIEVLRGDQLTLAICRKASEMGVSIALVGGKDEAILKRMVVAIERACPGLDVAFAWSPPFRKLNDEEERAMIARLTASGAKIIFVGLGCPKQERWMATYRERIPAMMIGVGAAFDFISGQVKAAPPWMHYAGLEWLNRLISEPRRLWKRYLTTSPRFIWLFLTREWNRKAIP